MPCPLPTDLSQLHRAIEPIARDLLAGELSFATSKRHGISHSVVAFVRQSLGLRMRRPRLTENRIEAALEYSLSHTIQDTADHFGVSPSTIHRYIRKACGIEP